MKRNRNNQIGERQVAIQKSLGQDASERDIQIAYQIIFIKMNYFAQIIFFIFGGHHQSVQKKIFVFKGCSFARLAEFARLNDKFFTFGADLERKNLQFLQAIVTEPNIIGTAREAGDGEEDIKNKILKFL